MDLTTAASRALHLRALYEELEKRLHRSSWTPQELFIGFGYDVGDLGRLVMATQGRWMHEGDLPEELAGKLSECLWWILVLSERLGVDIAQAFPAKMDELERELTASVAKSQPPT
jgi:NTP pyrophosphatase (non-canonical NTP hydrolase)